MRVLNGELLFSASDLMRFMGCRHATTLDLMRLRGEGPEPRADSEDAELLQKQGDAHEAAHLSEWLQLQPEQTNGRIKDPRFWSYPAYLQLNHESIPLIDEDSWYYEEPVDIKPWNSFRLEDDEGQIWCFESKNNHLDTGSLSRLPYSKRIAEQEKAKAKEANNDA